jgi:hypothetical protein
VSTGQLMMAGSKTTVFQWRISRASRMVTSSSTRHLEDLLTMTTIQRTGKIRHKDHPLTMSRENQGNKAANIPKVERDDVYQ